MTKNPDVITLNNAPAHGLVARQKRIRRDRIILVASVVLVAAAWVYGFLSNGTDIAPLVPEVIPGAAHIEKDGDLFIGLDADRAQVLGYAAVGEAPGYGGPISVLVGVAPDGTVSGVQIVEQRESPGFFRLIENQDFVAQYLGKLINQPLRLDNDIDAVSGATTSSEGIALSIREAARQISAQALDQPLPPEQHHLEFGAPELAVLALYAIGYIGHKMRNRTWQKRIRWTTLFGGLIFIGFVYTIPFTITMVVSLISGFWPDWHTSLYWYLLIGGILFVATVDAKNPYCSWFCPFGAFQEILGGVTGAKLYRPRDLSEVFTWLQRGLTLVAIVLGLLLRRPGVAGYEPFATLFDLRGAAIEWIFLALVILASLVIFRPFCNYLCPLDPIFDFIAAARKWFREGVKTWRNRSAKI